MTHRLLATLAAAFLLVPCVALADPPAFTQGDIPIWDEDCAGTDSNGCFIPSGRKFRELVSGNWVGLSHETAADLTNNPALNVKLDMAGASIEILQKRISTCIDPETGEPDCFIGPGAVSVIARDGAGMLDLGRIEAESNAALRFCIYGKTGGTQPPVCQAFGMNRPSDWSISEATNLAFKEHYIREWSTTNAPGEDPAGIWSHAAPWTEDMHLQNNQKLPIGSCVAAWSDANHSRGASLDVELGSNARQYVVNEGGANLQGQWKQMGVIIEKSGGSPGKYLACRQW